MNNPKSKFARRYSFSEYGHVERNEKMGEGFSLGRLGHLWSMVDGVALAHPDKSVLMSGSDGSQTQNQVTGLGIPFGTWLLERGYKPRYKHLGIAKPGEGGGLEQVGFHGLEPEHLVAAVKELAR